MKTENAPYPIAVMDGTCALCAFGARIVHKLDRSGEIRIAPIQGATGAQLMIDHGLDPLDPTSWLIIEPDGALTYDLDAVIRLGQMMGGLGHVFSVLWIIPKPLRSWMYKAVARNRYRWFGRGDMCAFPNDALRARLLM